MENGFYYDMDLGKATISEEDFGKIEAAMKKVIKADQPFERSEMPIDEAIAWSKKADQPYKTELLNDLKRAGTTAAGDLDLDELAPSLPEDKRRRWTKCHSTATGSSRTCAAVRTWLPRGRRAPSS